MQFMPSIVKEFLKRFQIYPKQIFFSGLRGCIKMLKLTQFRKRASNNLNKKRFVLQNTYMKNQTKKGLMISFQLFMTNV